MWKRVVSLVNGRVVTPDGEASSIRFDTRILGVDERPRPRDGVIDLDGAVVFPGLINAHDHLELNHYGRLKYRGRYLNVSGWIDDMRPRLQYDPAIREAKAHSLADRLFIGGFKNLLSGVTTVAHHNPLYAELDDPDFPVRVVRRYGWAHSLRMQIEPAGANGELGGRVDERYRATPADAPFFLHAAEGIDEEARSEVAALEGAGCLAANTVLIHGVGIDRTDWMRVARARASLVWCPGSNLFLFDRTAPVRDFLQPVPGMCRARIALGTDSRLSGRRDLLEELDAAANTEQAAPEDLLRMVTSGAADVIREARAGRLRVGMPADLLVLPALADEPARTLVGATRRDVRLVVREGRPLLADPDAADILEMRRNPASRVRVDGADKWLDGVIARRLAACGITERGVERPG